MKIKVDEWKPFQTGRLFTMLNGKGITQEEIYENPGDLNAVQSGEENNGVIGRIDIEYCRQKNYVFVLEPCLTVARTGTAGFVSFQKDGCVVGDSAKILLLPNEIATIEIYLFLQTILTANRFKYTYGRKVTEEKYLNEIIKLPVQIGEDGLPIVDRNYRFSDEGFIPDWNFMNNYIKELHYKPLTTSNLNNNKLELNTNNWKEYTVEKIFPKKQVKHFSAMPEEEGIYPFISSTSNNNGVAGYVDGETNPGNCITVSTNGDGFDCFYQPNEFVLSNDAEALYNPHLNVFCAMFIISVLKMEKIKYGYGRKPKNDKVYKTIIKLPSDEKGEPDWNYMEEYIKHLPYGDRLI